ncbi:cation transporter [Methylobacterium sp. ID0610]|uniref:cation transporter n=1 Tax=Methylobacterium carpenticola TaxID=3344827 RepID=UPI0036A3F68E
MGRADIPAGAGRSDYTRRLWAIAALTLAAALGEAALARATGSRGLLGDAGSFGYDIALNGVAALVFGRGARIERLSALVIAGILLATGIDGLTDFVANLRDPAGEEVGEVVTANLVATLVACLAALTLRRFRADDHPLVRATWLNARNDAIATLTTAALGLLATLAPARWPGALLDLAGVVFSFQAAASVLWAAWREMRPAVVPDPVGLQP